MVNVEKQKSSFVSSTFKIWLAGIIFILTFFHLYTIAAYPNAEIIPPEVLLSTVLILIGYLWIQELRDRHRLELTNRALVESQKRLERAEVETIAALVLTEEAKDSYTRGHSRRVTAHSLSIASELGFSQEQQKVISRAGILHDLGKLGISDSILKKPDKLTPEEWLVMCEHSQRAVDILYPLEFLKEEKLIILHHHEKYDGTGYPDRLKGEDIPLGARIVAVADTFDAMNSERPYRKSLPHEFIIEELKRVAGNQLDPSIVDIFLDLLNKKPQLWERD